MIKQNEPFIKAKIESIMFSGCYVIADVFTQKPLEGNPVAVFTDARDIGPESMQRIARELNLSETIFILPPRQDGDFRVRIFTPVNELSFAGHPTLGASIVLGQATQLDQIKLETAMGTIPFALIRNGMGDVISAEMCQPIPTWEKYDLEATLLEGLGLTNSTLPVEIYYNGPRHVFVGLPSISALSNIKPDLRILAKLPNMAANCFAGNDTTWQMRMFSPAYGVAEDAATGSAAGPLALHLARYGIINFNQAIEIHQGVEMGKRSVMRAKVEGNLREIKSIKVSGSAVIVAKGEFFYW